MSIKIIIIIGPIGYIQVLAVYNTRFLGQLLILFFDSYGPVHNLYITSKFVVKDDPVLFLCFSVYNLLLLIITAEPLPGSRLVEV